MLARLHSSVALRFLDAGRVQPASSPSALEEVVIELFSQHRNPLMRYALSFGISTHDAEEVVQEVFLALFQHLQQGKSRANLRGWSFRVAHNLTLRRRMRNSRRTRFECAESAAHLAPDPQPNPEQLLEQEQRRRNLLRIVDALPETDRCCLNLRAEGLRYREIASVLGISLGGVALSLGRSLKRLREAHD